MLYLDVYGTPKILEYVISGRIWHSVVHFIWLSIIKDKNSITSYFTKVLFLWKTLKI